MKKLILPIMTALLILSFFPPTVYAASVRPPSAIPINPPVSATPAEVLLNRLDEINTMSKSEMIGTQKRALRKEVREIKRELKALNQGVYLSVGAIIVIVLLLLLLL
ncbi:hypothetical protein [Lewinella sp. LCG006]|uniref:hypothetical protein n=1 Tax=Lewinella sp. LCG006 TaxID=3231911 RepID=UPI003460D453